VSGSEIALALHQSVTGSITMATKTARTRVRGRLDPLSSYHSLEMKVADSVIP
jgi:hypothetical protein